MRLGSASSNFALWLLHSSASRWLGGTFAASSPWLAFALMVARGHVRCFVTLACLRYEPSLLRHLNLRPSLCSFTVARGARSLLRHLSLPSLRALVGNAHNNLHWLLRSLATRLPGSPFSCCFRLWCFQQMTLAAGGCSVRLYLARRKKKNCGRARRDLPRRNLQECTR
jgi:hypothetical protein